MTQHLLRTAPVHEREKNVGAKAKGRKEHVRKKAWRPKTKTGCITCRIRRVKCDEAKPNCNRCESTGRTCDGYASASAAQSSASVCPPVRIPASTSPGLIWDSAEEQEAFHFFKYNTAHELSGFFDSAFWQYELLQASHSHPAIRHGVIAMAALHRKFIAGTAPVVPDEICDKQLQFALQQSNQAIQELRKRATRRSASDCMDVMTACILFYYLACFQGHSSAALEHLRSGLKILREVDEGNTYSTPQHHPIKLATLRDIFVVSDVQARGIMGDEALKSWVPHPKRDFSHVSEFRTFANAREHFQSTFFEYLAFRQEIDVNPPTGPMIELVRKQHLEFERRAAEMNDRLDAFLGQLSYVASDDDRESMLSIRLFYEQVKAYMKIFQGYDVAQNMRKIDWHIDEQDMGVLLDLVSQLLKAPSDVDIPAQASDIYCPSVDNAHKTSPTGMPTLSRPVFGSCSGLLSALWLAASSAHSLELRRRAIALMLNYPRREGIWDGVVAGRIALECLLLEEKAAEVQLDARRDHDDARSDYIPEVDRIRCVGIRYVAARVMEVEFQSVKKFAAGEPGWRKFFAW